MRWGLVAWGKLPLWPFKESMEYTASQNRSKNRLPPIGTDSTNYTFTNGTQAPYGLCGVQEVKYMKPHHLKEASFSTV